MLMTDDDRIDSDGLVSLVLNRHLTFCVGTKPANRLVFPQPGSAAQQFVRVHNRRGHQFGSFVAGKAEHHALIARALQAFEFRKPAPLNALVDVGTLRVNHIQHCHGIAVQPVIGIRVADIPRHIAGNFLKIHRAFRNQLAANQHQPRGRKRFARNMAFGILRKARVQNGIGNLITQFVGVTFAY